MAKRIIVPLDQSEVAEAALPVARGLVAQLGLPVTLVSVVEGPQLLAGYVPGGERPPAPQISSRDVPQSPYGRWTGWTSAQPTREQIENVSQRSKDAESYLNRIAESFDDVPVEVTVRFGHPAERILQVAEERPGSIIVLASHGRAGLQRAMMGSVASHVVRGASSPVLVVRATARARVTQSPVTFEKALVALDGSPFSEQALPVLEDIFGPDSLDIHLLNVIEEPFSDPEENKSYLNWIAEKLSTSTKMVNCETCEGTPAEAINARARERGVDLIAMTTHGYSGIRRFLLGSVAEQVLQSADRPLLVIRPVE